MLAAYQTPLGQWRRIRAMWAAAKTFEAELDDSDGHCDYDEATDTYYLAAGWYECNGFEETNWQVQDEILLWMPLPPLPDVEG